MGTAAALGLSLSEETLTECALYNIAVAHQGKDIVIDLATKPAEAKHGADWEWWLVCGKKGIGFRVQAKRLFPDGRYRSLRKSGANPYEQLDKLISASASAGLQPLYCFFNFPHQQFNRRKNVCTHPYRGPSFWGCSLAFPDQVKSVHSNRLNKLIRIMFPWHLLVCESDSVNLLAAVTNFIRVRRPTDNVIVPSDLPSRVRRLMEIGDQTRKAPDHQAYLDDAYWDAESKTPDDLSGLIVVRDLR
jgi:hypothetical protein